MWSLVLSENYKLIFLSDDVSEYALFNILKRDCDETKSTLIDIQNTPHRLYPLLFLIFRKAVIYIYICGYKLLSYLKTSINDHFR